MKVSIGVSARHVHVTKEVFKELFGSEELTVFKPINQPGMFASNEMVTIKTSKGEFNNVRILGPFRSYNQVEISKTDAYTLGLNPPVRKSGDLIGAEEITIIGPLGEITLNCCIIANRHIHITTKEANELGIKDDQRVLIKISTEKRGVIEAFYKVSDEAYKELHIDLDDANAFLLKQGDEVEIL